MSFLYSVKPSTNSVILLEIPDIVIIKEIVKMSMITFIANL